MKKNLMVFLASFLLLAISFALFIYAFLNPTKMIFYIFSGGFLILFCVINRLSEKKIRCADGYNLLQAYTFYLKCEKKGVSVKFTKIKDSDMQVISSIASGYEFTSLDANSILELTTGTLESYTSANGKTAYRMVYQAAEAQGEMITVVMRLVLMFIMHENNQEMLLGILRDNFGMTADVELYVGAVLAAIAKSSVETQLGMDSALAIIYYIFYGADLGVDNATNGIKDLNAEWTKLLKDMQNSRDEGEALAGEIIAGILDLDIFDDIIDPEEGIAPNGFIAFFQKLSSLFQKIIDWFKNIFG